MSKNPILAVIACVFVWASFGANHAVGQMKTAVLRRLPIETFPKQVGDFRCVEELPADPEVAKVLPSAIIVSRVYRDLRGREISLLLLTATDYADFHDPNICFPAQGFTLSPAEKVTLGGVNARLMSAERGQERLRVLYWWGGEAAVDTTYGREQMGKLLALRDRVSGKQGQSLFVRVLLAEGSRPADADLLLRAFAADAQPSIKALIAPPAG